MESEKKIILESDPEAATLVEDARVWKSSRGKYFFDERAARYDGATHQKCRECEKLAELPYTLCEQCRKQKDTERYNNLEKADWDGKGYLYSEEKDRFYEELEDAVDDLEEGESLEDLRLLICKPVYAVLDEDCFADDIPEDADTPDWLLDAIDVFNETTRSCGPLSWAPTKTALRLRKKYQKNTNPVTEEVEEC